MTVNEILDFARDEAHATSAQFPNTKLIIWANIVYKKLVNKIIREVTQNYFPFFQEIDAVTTGDGGYTYDASLNRLKSVKIKPFPDSDKYVVSQETDFSKEAYDISWFMENQPIGTPVHQIIGTKIYIAPQFTADNTGGAGNKQIYLQFEDTPADLVVGGAENTILLPPSQHSVIAYGIIPMIQAANAKKTAEIADRANFNNETDSMIADMSGKDDTAMYIRVPNSIILE